MSLATELRKLQAEVGDLEEESGGEWTADQAREWLERGPVAFGAEKLGSEYWSRQVDLLRAVWDSPRVAIRSANSMGKNFTAADLMAWWAFAKRGTVIYMAPTDRQLSIGMRELKRALRGSGLPFELYHRVLRVKGDDRVLAMTSNSADSLRGFHDANGLLVVIDEGQGQAVEAVAYDAAFSCATGEGDRILVLGNPAHPGGRFHQISQQANWTSLRIPAWEHPNIEHARVVIPGGPAPDWPKTIEDEYGLDSPFYVAFVEAEFPDTSIDGLVEAAWIERATARPVPKEIVESTVGRPLLLILDVARYGPDESVLGEMQGDVLHGFETWQGQSLVDTADRVKRQAEWLRRFRHEPILIVLDDAGVGGGVTDTLRDWDVEGVKPFNAASSPRAATGSDPDRFLNARAQAYWAVREKLRTGSLCIPPDGKLEEELLATTYGLNSKGKIQITSKDDIRARIGRSPDRADVLAMGCWDGVRARAQTFEWRIA